MTTEAEKQDTNTQSQRDIVINQADTLLKGLSTLLSRLINVVFPPPIVDWTSGPEILGESPSIARARFSKTILLSEAKSAQFSECEFTGDVQFFVNPLLVPVQITMIKCVVPDSLLKENSQYKITVVSDN